MGYLLEQAPVSWLWLEEGADVGNMLTVRRVLTELAGAAYAMQNAPVFLAATETMLRYSLASSHSYTATPAQLLLDVALGITLGGPEAAHQAAVAPLAASGKDDPALPMPLEATARTLARQALGGMPMAELSAQDVVSACVAKRTVKYATAYFIGWADGAAALAQGNGGRLHEALLRVDRAHHSRLEAGQVSAARGRPATGPQRISRLAHGAAGGGGI